MPDKKDWWARIFKYLFTRPHHGLFELPGKSGLFEVYLRTCADHETGIIHKKTHTMSQEIHKPQRSIENWIKALKKHGRIKILSPEKQSLVIQIVDWKHQKSIIKLEGATTNLGGSEKDIKKPTTTNLGGSLPPILTATTNLGGSVNLNNKWPKPPFTTNLGGCLMTPYHDPNLRKERERLPLANNFTEKNMPKTDSDKPPNDPLPVQIIIDHLKTEFQRIHDISVNTFSSRTWKILRKLLEDRPVEEIKFLITQYLSIDDDTLRKRGFPVEWLPDRIAEILMNAGPTPQDEKEREEKIKRGKEARKQQLKKWENSNDDSKSETGTGEQRGRKISSQRSILSS